MNVNNDNRVKILIYLVLILWILYGVLALLYTISLFSLAAYFVSLTGFIGTYTFTFNRRPSTSTPIYKSGKTSSRELMVYIVILLWCIAGYVAMYTGYELDAVAAYFAALTPFVSTYLIGRTFNRNKTISKELDYNPSDEP